MDNPRELINFEHAAEHKDMYCGRVLRDQDFLQSFKKLDITERQSEKILAQIDSDVELLSKHGFMDYSLFVVVVIKPMKRVDYFK